MPKEYRKLGPRPGGGKARARGKRVCIKRAWTLKPGAFRAKKWEKGHKWNLNVAFWAIRGVFDELNAASLPFSLFFFPSPPPLSAFCASLRLEKNRRRFENRPIVNDVALIKRATRMKLVSVGIHPSDEATWTSRGKFKPTCWNFVLIRIV